MAPGTRSRGRQHDPTCEFFTGFADGVPPPPHRRENQQVKLQEELNKRKQVASKSSVRRAALSAAGGSSSHCNHANKHHSRTEHMDPAARCDVTKTLNTSFMEMDVNGNVIPKTPQAPIMAATTYFASHPPPVGDPKSAMHKSTLARLGLVGSALHGEAPAELKKKAVVRFNRS